MVDLKHWPEVCLGKRAVTVPLPLEGRAGHHVCATAVPSECPDCIAARERADRVERARMLSGEMVIPKLRPKIVEAWE